MNEVIEIRPQPKQELFLRSSADIVVFGGAAGGGKTWSLLVEPLRHLKNKDFGAVMFRRTITEITREGGPWSEAEKLYPLLGGMPNLNERRFTFEKGARVTFSHLQREVDKYGWKSAQVPLMLYDQLETFTRSQFFYMLSRNRSTCGVRPYIRATANPEPGWLADFLDWWIAPDGYADLNRAGKVRWMAVQDEKIVWSNSRAELEAAYPGIIVKSVTFIPSTIYDNAILMERDPGYLGNLQAQDYIERERLLGDPERGGNWKIKPTAGKVFNRAWFTVLAPNEIPDDGIYCRFWDFAATEKQLAKGDPDYTASVLMMYNGKSFYILDVTAERISPAQVEAYYMAKTNADAERYRSLGRAYRSRFEVEPGSASKREAARFVRALPAVDVQGKSSTQDKLVRARPLAAQALSGNVYLMAAPWNDEFLNHLHGQPELPHDDMMDAAAGAYNELAASAPRQAKIIRG